MDADTNMKKDKRTMHWNNMKASTQLIGKRGGRG